MNATPAQRLLRPAPLVALFGIALAAFVWWAVRSGDSTPALRSVPHDLLVRRDGLFFEADGTNRFTGFVTENHPSGEPKSRSAVADGRLHGLSEGWHTNGVRQIEEHFAAGLSHGLRTKWHPNGQKASEAPVVSGEIEGVFRRWHENGALAEEITLVRNVPNGPARSWHPDGSLKATATMKDGQIVQQKFYAEGEQPAGQDLAATHSATR
jgi:antitoxin component YwqK of YwqJK toxin-antitoxin module